MEVDLLEEDIEKLENVIQTISKNKAVSGESQASKKIQELRKEREELDTTVSVIDPQIVEEQKRIVGKSIVESLGEANFMDADFTEKFLAVIADNKEQLILEIKRTGKRREKTEKSGKSSDSIGLKL